MAEHAMSGPDPSKTIPSAGALREQPQHTRFETDLADLATRFATQSGGGLSPELSADLALEIVLNEIVEQACLATGASGAAIVLEREGEMVCRASSGSTAPELGSRLDTSSGLSGECFKTGHTQWCDDTMADQRADAKASERLGVRSVVVMPLLRGATISGSPIGGTTISGTTIMGVIELFSAQPYAFGVRDERTLEILADRTLNNLDCAARPLELQKAPEPVAKAPEPAAKSPRYWSIRDQPSQPENGGAAGKIGAGADRIETSLRVENGAEKSAPAESSKEKRGADEKLVEAQSRDQRWPKPAAPRERSFETSPAQNRKEDQGKENRKKDRPKGGWEARSDPDAGSWLLGAAAVACAILLSLVVGRHWGARNAALHTRPRVNKSAEATTRTQTPTKDPDPASAPASAATKSDGSRVPPGGLLISENGKEVFRMPAKRNQTATADQGAGVTRASSVEPDGVMELSPAAAEGSLLQRVEPDYPEAAREQNIQGTVELEVHIAADGGVQDVRVISGPPLLAEAGTAAVKQWKFKPQVVKGSPVEMQTRITLKFRLPPQKLPQ